MRLTERQEARLWRWIIRVAALIGVTNETFFEEGERPFLLTFFAALLGLPQFMFNDVIARQRQQPAAEKDDEG